MLQCSELRASRYSAYEQRFVGFDALPRHLVKDGERRLGEASLDEAGNQGAPGGSVSFGHFVE
ncbi:hypothetical protein IEQ34_021095 [Dendrobium chrysotoxum]|uniref:Uncharacterized protein n=1 Tax=Dendrobium chrysotoxum TaxID=161865 RepID=A0AAV7G3Y7_DENCH|nr:hypothetical protein IEQ34_021095 [Dendrobium chrysotoxum]